MIDVHCHLYDEQFKGEQSQIVSNFLSAGVGCAICASSDLDSAAKAKQIADEFDCVYYTVGVHPDEAENFDPLALEQLLKSASNKLVAVGEIGLDYYQHPESAPKDRQKQKQAFIAQIELANKYHLPVVIHCRDAYGDTLQILKATPPKYGFEFHCFSGSLEYANELLRLGGYLSFTGNVTFKNAKNIQAVAQNLPVDRIMFETDSPYLAPVPNRGKRNEPKNVLDVLKFVADLRAMPATELEHISDQTAKKFFNICK